MVKKALYEAADVARLFDLTPAGIRYNVKAGHLRVAARTRRGSALFTDRELEEFRRNRQTKERSSGR